MAHSFIIMIVMFVTKQIFYPNTGYCFPANNNSWHCAKVGAERKSPL